MNKILLVDDDRELTSLLKELLDMEGFNVLVAHDGEQALSLLDDSIDLLLLDVMMPKKNGIDTLKELRQTHQTPVIMLTARGSELDRVLGLELGADDYLPKPFNDRELVARIRAILRRSHWSEQQQNTENSSPTLEVDSLSLNPGRQEASFDGQTLELTGTEFTLLYLLAQHLGQPSATRAVGAANGRNPLPIILPCHRVIGSNGALTGFSGGLETKAALLRLEQRQAPLFA